MILGGDVFRMGEWLRGRRKWLRGRQKWLRGRGGWLRGRRRGMPALSRLFRFQISESLGILRFPCWYRTQRQFIRLWLKNCLGACAPLFVQQNTKGFQHSSTVTRNPGQASTSGCFRACFRALRSAGKELRLET